MDVLSGGKRQQSGKQVDRAVAEVMERLGARDAVVLVKSWARRRRVLGAYEGFLSSFCWTLLVLYALRRRTTCSDGGPQC